MTARLVAKLIVVVASLITGLRALGRDASPISAPTLYFANHASHGDFVLVWAALPAEIRKNTRPVAAADYWLASRLRRFLGQSVFHALLIQRDPALRTSNPVQQMAQALASGSSLIMFPEGTRNTSDEPLLPLKSGLYHVAQQCPQARLVPVWIENLRRVLPKGTLIPVPLACTVTFGEPLVLMPDESKADFLARARQAMLSLRTEYDTQEN